MNLMTLNDNTQTMTSREIADLTGKRHDNVKRTIEDLLNKGLIESPQIEEVRTATNIGKCYAVGKRDSFVIVARLSPEFTARLVDRWQELEEKVQQPAINLNDPAQLRGLLSNYAERVIALEEKVEEAAPKVEFVDNYVKASGLIGFREMCKLLGIKEYAVRDWLVSKGIIYKLGGKWAFSASWLDAKNGEHKTSYDVYERAAISIKFTPKGFAYIAQRISK